MFKKGDRVRRVIANGHCLPIGYETEVLSEEWDGLVKVKDSEGFNVFSSYEYWEKIGEVEKAGPIVTETVTTTKKKLLSGKYGRVYIADAWKSNQRGGYSVVVHSAGGNKETSASLDEIISTLTEIRDFLKE